MQRQLETEIRRAKDKQILAKTSGDDVLRREAQKRINLLQSKYKQFSDAAGLPYKANRMSVSGFHRVSAAPKGLTINAKGNIIIPRSVGAAGKNYPVRLPDGNYTKFAEGSQITKIKVFAGKGTDTEIRERFRLEAEYKEPADDWQKCRGEGEIIEYGATRKAEIHWYEANNARIKMKVKRYLDES